MASAVVDPSAEGGVALLTASFTDPGFVDTHTATVSWGDGSPPEAVPVSAQGAGWGGLYASHVYAARGSYQVTVTATDNDRGVSTAVAATVHVAVPVALWSNSTSAATTIDLTSGSATIEGLTHTNRDLRVRGGDKRFVGPVEYAGVLDAGANTSFSEPPAKVAAGPFPIRFR